jgi:hypothetical protein
MCRVDTSAIWTSMGPLSFLVCWGFWRLQPAPKKPRTQRRKHQENPNDLQTQRPLFQGM